MTDHVDATTRSRIMSRIRSKNTAPELTVRRALHAAGFRFRLHPKELPGKPDIVLPRYRLAVLVHGCFWHGHHCLGRRPRSNEGYWEAKIRKNQNRDVTQVRALEEAGWECRVIWACELSQGVADLLRELQQRRSAGSTLRGGSPRARPDPAGRKPSSVQSAALMTRLARSSG